uniref:Uncharacterized protein n=1 Tax=uncultured marine virus TaxID=186617 RepID=A0A0F7L1Q0_9VIRU|nr:hypothetical protein [uncultured marine virus]
MPWFNFNIPCDCCCFIIRCAVIIMKHPDLCGGCCCVRHFCKNLNGFPGPW